MPRALSSRTPGRDGASLVFPRRKLRPSPQGQARFLIAGTGGRREPSQPQRDLLGNPLASAARVGPQYWLMWSRPSIGGSLVAVPAAQGGVGSHHSGPRTWLGRSPRAGHPSPVLPCHCGSKECVYRQPNHHYPDCPHPGDTGQPSWRHPAPIQRPAHKDRCKRTAHPDRKELSGPHEPRLAPRVRLVLCSPLLPVGQSSLPIQAPSPRPLRPRIGESPPC